MPKSMRPVVKLEDGEGGAEAEGVLQEEAGAGRAVQRRRVGEAKDSARDEVRLLRLNMEAHAQAIQQARALGDPEELQRAKAREVELSAQLRINVEALQSIIQAKDDQLQANDLLLQAKDTELRLLRAENARLSAGSAAGGAAAAPAAIAVSAAAAAPAPSAPGAPFPFSARHTGSVLSNNCLTVTQPNMFYLCYWTRSERGVGAGCGLVRWVVQLGKESGGRVYMLGVASDAFNEHNSPSPCESWFFRDNCMFSNGQQQGEDFDPPPFDAGDVVTVELERAPGVDGVLRVRVAGKTPRELKGLPRDGMLYPIVCLCSSKQSITMVAPP